MLIKRTTNEKITLEYNGNILYSQDLPYGFSIKSAREIQDAVDRINQFCDNNGITEILMINEILDSEEKKVRVITEIGIDEDGIMQECKEWKDENWQEIEAEEEEFMALAE